jgi:hypothetical protein
MEYEGRLTVQRGFGLTDHLLTLKVKQSCYVPLNMYNINVIHATLSRMKKVRGLHFETKIIRQKNEPASEVKVTRVK